MKNTCSLALKLTIDANKKSSKLYTALVIDGEVKQLHKDNNFRGNYNDIAKIIDNAIKLIEKDNRFKE